MASTLHHWQPGDQGPHPHVPPAVHVLYGIMCWNEGGQRGAERLFRSKVVWAPIRTIMDARYPGYPGLQPGAAPVSRSEFWRYCDTYAIEPCIFGALVEEFEIQAAALAKSMGMFDASAGSVTHPARQNVLVGDGTVLRPRTDAVRDQLQVDMRTGIVEQKRYEPDASFFKTGDGTTVVRGTKFGFVESRLPHVNERVILGVFNVPAGKGHSEAAEALKVIDRAQDRLPESQAVAWDMAMRGTHADRMYQRGLQPIVKTAKSPGGKPRSRFIEVHTAKLVDGTEEQLSLWAMNGGLSILVVAAGEEHLVQCERKQTYRRANARGGCRWYMDATIPDDPRVPPRLRHARIPLVRLDTTADDRKTGLNRADNLRAIHEGDADWDRLYGLRPGAESTNRWFKERLRDTRAPAIGVPRQHLHLVFGALFNNFRAWLAHGTRVGTAQPGSPPQPPPAVTAPVAPPPSG
ncbi:MAG: hypothetical protein M3346_00715 [Actinomycetota bacterium]|nr:hypothetical protein [Actinomycetota bacterium]